MKVYYLRVSTLEQKTDRQKTDIPIDAKVYEDKCSGSVPFAERKEGSKIMKLCENGEIDTLNVHSIDRLGRSTLDILNTIQKLTSLGVNVVSTKEGISTIIDGKENPIAKMIISVLATLSEFEKTRIKERQTEGIAAAKLKGAYNSHGGKVAESTEKFLSKAKSKLIAKYLNEGNSVRRAALLSRSSLATAFKVSTLIRERKEVKEVKSIEISVPKVKESEVEVGFTGSALEWINLPKNKEVKARMTPDELAKFVGKRND
jgi:DNA invertase Pin-like site-specific DNA recombinase